MNYITGEVLLYDANGRIIQFTEAGEMKSEVIQKPDTFFQNYIVDPTNPAYKAEVTVDKELKVNTGATASADGFLQMQSFGSLIMGESFASNSIDTIYRWLEEIVGSGSKTITDTTIVLDVTTANNDSIKQKFKQTEIAKVPGAYTKMYTAANVGTSFEPGNIKEWGLEDFSGGNGIYYRVSGNNLYFITKLNNIETVHDITSELHTDGQPHLYEFELLGQESVNAYIDEAQVYATGQDHTLLVGAKYMIPFMRHYNTSVLAGPADPLQINWISLMDLSGSRMILTGRDDNNFIRDVAVSPTRRLLVSQEPPTPPPSTTSINAGGIVLPAKNEGIIDTPYTITAGKILTLQRWSYGAQAYGGGGGKAEIWYDPDGDMGVNASLITAPAYFEINHGSRDLNKNYTGDGTARIVLRVTNYTPTNGIEFSQYFDGYES